MSRDTRLSVALHVLLHLQEGGKQVPSEVLGPMASVNPVVLRRTLAGLRDAGIVRSGKGHGGGWALARPLAEVTLGDVHDALGKPAFFAVGLREEEPRCLLEQAANRALRGAMAEAEALLVARLRSVTVAALLADVAGQRGQGGVDG